MADKHYELLKPHAKAQAILDKEIEDLKASCLTSVHAFASDPRLIAYRFLINFIEDYLATDPITRSIFYSRHSHNAHISYRYADTYGWRIYLTVNENDRSARVLHLVRVIGTKISNTHALRQFRDS